jgi:hypothetical protein
MRDVMSGLTKKIKCHLPSHEGNVFWIISSVDHALRSAGQVLEADEYLGKCEASGSYEEIIKLSLQYVEFINSEAA